MMLNRLLRRDIRGIGAVEFALIAPVLITFIIGVAQLGKFFYASADMKNALATGARVASVWPAPENPDIIAAVNAQISRSGGAAVAEVSIPERGTDSNGNEFVLIKMDYEVDLDFIFFNAGPITLSDTRRVYTQMNGVMPPADNGGTTTTSTTTGGTTTGGTTSTSATSAGGTSSTSATSASSTGGTTSATSASTTSTTSSTTSSGSNGNGNGNGNSNGNSSHGHGDCKNKC